MTIETFDLYPPEPYRGTCHDCGTEDADCEGRAGGEPCCVYCLHIGRVPSPRVLREHPEVWKRNE